jgi:hypothetical protein
MARWDLIEPFDFWHWIWRVATFGWRYLLSPSFRHATNERWRHETMLRVVWEMVEVIGSIALPVLAAAALVAMLFGWW